VELSKTDGAAYLGFGPSRRDLSAGRLASALGLFFRFNISDCVAGIAGANKIAVYSVGDFSGIDLPDIARLG
jgi:hypothetical protein